MTDKETQAVMMLWREFQNLISEVDKIAECCECGCGIERVTEDTTGCKAMRKALSEIGFEWGALGATL